jgi:hypothetical protein
MYCSTCGASIPNGRARCETCGSAAEWRREPNPEMALSPATDRAELYLRRVGVCPRCDYHGQGLPYFTRGPHVAALVGATLFTLPYALGAGGLLYYGLRHDHRVCPRCGKGWGKFGRVAFQATTAEPTAVHHPQEVRNGGISEGVRRAWSVMLFVVGALMLAVGAMEAEALLFVFGALAASGGVVLHQSANKAREARRAGMIASLQKPVLKLAAERKGLLTVTDVAASLGWSMRRAEKVLQSLDDGWRVNSEVTDEGVIVYEFRELLLGRGPPPEEV